METNTCRKLSFFTPDPKLVLALVFLVFEGTPAIEASTRRDKAWEGLRPTQLQSILEHSQELLGPQQARGYRWLQEQPHALEAMIFSSLQRSLPTRDRTQARPIAQAILEQSQKFNLDPVFVLSVIATESGFNPRAIGGVGERGLMQIRPETAQYIANRKGLHYRGPKNLEDPVLNIRIGTAYLHYLRTQFHRAPNKYISAYNMGPGRVRQLYREDRQPKAYTQRVMKNYLQFQDQFRSLVTLN
ncbi:MAG: lytic transglycosylase domain-containing protein [Bdellovibrio sp.]